MAEEAVVVVVVGIADDVRSYARMDQQAYLDGVHDARISGQLGTCKIASPSRTFDQRVRMTVDVGVAL